MLISFYLLLLFIFKYVHIYIGITLDLKIGSQLVRALSFSGSLFIVAVFDCTFICFEIKYFDFDFDRK